MSELNELKNYVQEIAQSPSFDAMRTNKELTAKLDTMRLRMSSAYVGGVTNPVAIEVMSKTGNVSTKVMADKATILQKWLQKNVDKDLRVTDVGINFKGKDYVRLIITYGLTNSDIAVRHVLKKLTDGLLS